MGSEVLKGVQMDTHLNQEQRRMLAKQSFRVIWKIKVDDNGLSEDDPNVKYVAGVCISSVGHILSMSLPTKPDVKYIGSCISWKKGWTTVSLVRTSTAYGLSLFQLEGIGHKKVDFTDLAESGTLCVNQMVYGVGHHVLSGVIGENTFVRGSVEYPCEDIRDLPPCLIDTHSALEGNQGGQPLKPTYHDGNQGGQPQNLTYIDAVTKSMSSRTRMVKHLTWISAVKSVSSTQGTIFSMHPDIPLIQIKNFHLGHCGGPVFVATGHVVGINLFKFRDINFAVHLSAINEFLKDVNLTTQMGVAPEEVEQTTAEDQPESIQEPQVVAAAKAT